MCFNQPEYETRYSKSARARFAFHSSLLLMSDNLSIRGNFFGYSDVVYTKCFVYLLKWAFVFFIAFDKFLADDQTHGLLLSLHYE